MGRIRSRITRGRRLAGIIPARSLVQSFNYAFEGLVYTLASQRNMRIHFTAAMVALTGCVLLGADRYEFMLVFFAASFVIATEMLNTAVEATIDVSTTTYNPLAKIGKDVAAGAVLVAAVNAMVVAYVVFANKLSEPSNELIVAVRTAPPHLAFIALTMTILGVIAVKAVTGGGTALRGGFPSGHAAIAFAVWMSVTLLTSPHAVGTLVSVLCFILALLVAQTRVESGVHTWPEVLAGAVFGSLVALIVFQLASA